MWGSGLMFYVVFVGFGGWVVVMFEVFGAAG